MSQFALPQIWPEDDLFTEGSTAYGTGVRRYLRVKPWATTLTDYDLVPAPEGGEPRLTQAGGNYPNEGEDAFGASFMPFGSGAAGNDISAFVERTTYLADAEVTITPQIAAIQGTLEYESFHCVGVCGRVQGGTLTTPGGATAVDEYHSVPNGYYFMQVKKSGEDPGLVLYKVSGGSVTVLEDSPLSDFERFTPGSMGGGNPRRMRMVITGTTTTRIQCYRRIKDSGPVISGQPLTQTEELIFDHSDSSSPISTAGRWGAVGAAPNEYTSTTGEDVQVITLLKSLRLRDSGGTTTYLREYWRRSTPAQLHITVDSFSGVFASPVNAKTLACAYTGDMLGASIASAGYNHYGHLIADSGSDRLVIGVDPTAAYPSTQQYYGWYFSLCPEASPQQHKKVTATFLTTATSPRETRALGLHLRGATSNTAKISGNTTETTIEHRLRSGYRAYVEYIHDSGTTDVFTLKVYHHNGSTAFNYVSTLLATYDLSATLALGTPFSLAVEARSFDVDPFGEGGDVALKFYINGSAITPVAESITGLSVEDDWLFDRRSDATYSGLMAGMYAMVETFNASGLITIDSYTSETLSDAPGDQTGTDQSTIPLAAETASKTGTLTIPASWPVTEIHDIGVLDIEFETLHRQTFPLYGRTRRVWSIQCLGATAQERQDLADFFESHLGTEIPFDWTYDVTNETVAVRFAQPGIASQLVSGVGDGAENMRFELVEVFDASTFNA